MVVRFQLRILGFLHTWSGYQVVVLICMGFLKSIRVDRLFVAVFSALLMCLDLLPSPSIGRAGTSLSLTWKLV